MTARRRTKLNLSLLLLAAALCALAIESVSASKARATVKEPIRQAQEDTKAGETTGLPARAETNNPLEKKLLKVADGVQYPGSESDSTWRFVSYPNETELPDTVRFEEISSCPVTEQGGTTRLDFDETFARLKKIEPWMDEGQVKSARGFRKIKRIMLRSYELERAVYRCDTGQYGQVYLYFVGVNEDGISGLLTVSTET